MLVQSSKAAQNNWRLDFGTLAERTSEAIMASAAGRWGRGKTAAPMHAGDFWGSTGVSARLVSVSRSVLCLLSSVFRLLSSVFRPPSSDL
jgi:hypothetical protein